VTVHELLDRETEQARLEAAWNAAERGRPQLVVLWGRRRVGKTYLLSHFTRNRRAVFFGATQQAQAVELARLVEAVRRDLGDAQADLAGGSFTSWETALRWFAALASNEPLALVVDELPYLLGSTPGVASVIQVVWDHLPPRSKLMLILTGSAVSVVEKLLGPGGALRGRPTLSLRLDPLDPVLARTFLPKMAAVSYFEAYAACGGYPLHLRAWDARASLSENLSRLAASADGLLLTDAAGILAEELPSAGGHARILAAIGRGRNKFGAIASDAAQRVEAPLETLVRAGFVRKALPVGAPKGAKPLYEISDTYLGFWFSCLYAHQTQIEAGQGQAVLARVQPLWQRHLGWVFEEAARAHATELVRCGKLPSDLILGRWWATRGEQCEVDVLGLRGQRTALVGEARWQERPLGAGDVSALRSKLRHVPNPDDKPLIALWARSGIAREARRAGALGWSLADMLGRAKGKATDA
jgi:AAA+ ATPase superfamily predicted ATPase